MNLVVRFVACLLVMALTGPSIVTLTCEWTCAAHHQAAATTDPSDCHGHHSDGETRKIAAGDACHDLLSGDVALRPVTLQVDLDLAVVETTAFVPFEPSPAGAFVTAVQHSPPATLVITPPLRI